MEGRMSCPQWCKHDVSFKTNGFMKHYFYVLSCVSIHSIVVSFLILYILLHYSEWIKCNKWRREYVVWAQHGDVPTRNVWNRNYYGGQSNEDEMGASWGMNSELKLKIRNVWDHVGDTSVDGRIVRYFIETRCGDVDWIWHSFIYVHCFS
jgi:hypothetical protein